MISWPSKSTLQRLLDLAGLHFTTSERSGPFWQSMLHNFLSRPLSFLGWTTAMLFWLDSTKHNLTSTNDSECSGTTGLQEPKRAHTSLCLLALATSCSSHPVQTLMLAYKTTTGSAPPYFHSLLQIYIPSWSLRSASERRLAIPSQRGLKSLSSTFSFTIPGWWNDPPPSRMLDPCQSSSNNWKLISFNTTWLHHKKKILSLFLYLHLSLYLSPSLASLYLFDIYMYFIYHHMFVYTYSSKYLHLCFGVKKLMQVSKWWQKIFFF